MRGGWVQLDYISTSWAGLGEDRIGLGNRMGQDMMDRIDLP